MTQKQFDDLPLMLTPAQAREVLGMDKRALNKWRRKNPGSAVHLDVEKKWRYYKYAVAAAAGVEYR
jgi:hypothetical protein